MATPRKRWFRVADSILHEAWPIEIKGVAVCLMAYLNTRWQRDGLSGDEASEVLLSPAAAMLVTGCQRLPRARSMLDKLAVYTSSTVDRRGVDTLFRWPKFAKFQAFDSPKMPSPTPTPDQTPESSLPSVEKTRQSEHAPLRSACGAEPPRAPAAVTVATVGQPERWASMLSREPGTAGDHEAFIAEVLPQIEAEAEARGHEPGSKRFNAAVRERLWAFWRQRSRPRAASQVVVQRESFAEREERARQAAFEAAVLRLREIKAETEQREMARVERLVRLDAQAGVTH